jgi:hypothetical protein
LARPSSPFGLAGDRARLAPGHWAFGFIYKGIAKQSKRADLGRIRLRFLPQVRKLLIERCQQFGVRFIEALANLRSNGGK